MSSKIEWTDETWNPVTGCTKVSPGCDHCYAERITNRFGGPGAFDQVVLHPERLEQPLRWRKPRRVFVNSMSDLFHEDVPDEYVARVFAVMAESPHHTFQILTKRHGRMRSLLRSDAFYDLVDREWCGISDWHWGPLLQMNDLNHGNVGPAGRWPLPNVWLGVSVETQQWANFRIPALLQAPAAVRFLSCEPLLGPITLALPSYDAVDNVHWDFDALRFLDWVIVGGESGPGARPMHPEWARSLRDQCTASGVPFLFKQWGGRTPKAGGRELDGHTWDQFPQEVRPA
jgi:protein gp37